MNKLFVYIGFVCLTSGAETPRFDQVTFARSHSHGLAYQGQIRFKPGPPSVIIHNATLKFCVQLAWHLNDYQVSGQSWIKSARYDIDASFAREAKPEEVFAALQGLLQERLQMEVRRETKDSPIYMLTIASGGPKLRVTTPAGAGETLSNTMHMDHATAAQFSENLSRRTDRLVVDRTGLEGIFDFSLNYGNSRNLVGPTLFKAVEHQLGLKLESSTGPVEYLTIERALKTPITP
jgi:uncharacterized protein (TIGR03435 family)